MNLIELLLMLEVSETLDFECVTKMDDISILLIRSDNQ